MQPVFLHRSSILEISQKGTETIFERCALQKNSAKKIRRAIRQQLQYICHDKKVIAKLLSDRRPLTAKYQWQLEVIEKLYEQQKYMYKNRQHSVSQRIVNLRQPHLRPIVRGKARVPTEFGAN